MGRERERDTKTDAQEKRVGRKRLKTCPHMGQIKNRAQVRKNLLYTMQVLHENVERSEHLGEACSAHWPTSTLGMLYSFPTKFSTAIKKRKKEKEKQKL